MSYTKSRKESLWKLANDLIILIDLPNPLIHECKRIDKKGFQYLFSYYKHGI